MEKTLFTRDGFDALDMMSFMFTDATLVRDIGPHRAGETFAAIVMNYEDGEISLFRSAEDGEPCYRGKLTLSVEP